MTINTQVYSRGDRLWCMGAKWFPVSRNATLNRAAVREARGYKATHTAIDEPNRQFALTDLSHAAARPSWRQPCYSAALAVRDALAAQAHHVYAVFELADDRYYLVGVVNRRVLLAGDQLLESEDVARAIFEGFQQTREWPNAVRIAPARWRIPDTVEDGIGHYLDDAKPDRATALRRPSAFSLWHYAAAVATVVAAYTTLEPVLFPPPPPPQRAVEAPSGDAASWEPLPATFASLSDASLWCAQMETQLLRHHPTGWPLEQAKCTDQGMDARYSRDEKAPYRYVLAVPGMTIADDSMSARYNEPAPPLPQHPLSLDALPAVDAVTATLRDAAGTLRATLKITEMRPKLRGDPAKAPPPPRWLRLEWTLTVTDPPSVWRVPLSRLSATTLTSVFFKAGTTTVEAITYALR
jgi:hypothetical protein